jgi:nucleoside-diphosphate-sugar epimerase
MDTVLVIGGTRFVGRHVVTEFLDAGYDVTLFNRGEHENPFADDDRVAHVAGDRSNDSALERAALETDPDVVVDCVAYEPRDVRAATEIFADVGAYVYVSSGAVYGRDLPKREDESPLRPYPGPDDAGYGENKAEGERAISAAADRGVNAVSVRPTVIYGPHDYTGRADFWVDRVANHDRVVVPGDGQNLWHRVFVADVASAVRIAAEEGAAGAAYNVGDRRLTTLAEFVERLADALDT